MYNFFVLLFESSLIMSRHFLFVAIVLFTASCGHQERRLEHLLLQVDTLVEVNPQYAFELLEQQLFKNIVDEELVARYSLLRTRVLDKINYGFSSDSCIMPAVNYFFECGTCCERAQVCFYKARILRLTASPFDSVSRWITMAEGYSNNCENDSLKALIFAEHAFFLFCHHDYEGAIVLYKQLLNIYQKHDKFNDMFCVTVI